jgi:hypothetical protein
MDLLNRIEHLEIPSTTSLLGFKIKDASSLSENSCKCVKQIS